MRLGRLVTSLASGTLVMVAACTDLVTSPHSPRFENGRDDTIGEPIDPPAGFTGMIRIGVIAAINGSTPTTSLTIGSPTSFTVINKTTGATIATGNAENLTAVLIPGGTPRTRLWWQVACTGSVATRDNWTSRVTTAGFEWYTEFVAGANCWRLRIGSLPTNATAAQRTAFVASFTAAGLTFPPTAPGGPFTVTRSDGVAQIDVRRGTTSLANVPGNVVLASPDGIVRIGTRLYRGVAEVHIATGGGAIAGVNELPLEQYLWGVVPRELGPIAFPELEALKAQSVAARTYAIANFNKRASDGYNLLPTTADQVYGGFQDEHPLSTQAVNETDGLIATVDRIRPIEALYFSTSGGFTANNEDVFNSAPVAYLRGIPDHQRGNSLENHDDGVQNNANARQLRATKAGDFEADWSRFHRWTFEWTNAEIRNVLSLWAGQDVGAVLAINVLERSGSGRVKTIEYVTEAGTFTDTKDRIRSSLRFIDASGAKVNLPSTLVYIEPVHDRKTKELTGFVAWGGGFGHGVGMSQTGAVGMAEKKASFIEILKHYYRGIELVPVCTNPSGCAPLL
ncbi:MAG TPA: SpoIID/LytB domain-containing protein [Gemmatimonadaceae bacterium]|nr:SpoIID/LytB domain-containing protein [Gemmatimonadaceae bacterium]